MRGALGNQRESEEVMKTGCKAKMSHIYDVGIVNGVIAVFGNLGYLRGAG